MKRILAVVNPIAGKKRKINPEQLVQDVLPNSIFVEWLYWSSVEMDIGLETINRLNSNSFDMVMVFGGDGTVNRIAQIMLHRKEALLIIPLGSGNGLARHLKIPMNPKKALLLALHGRIKQIDAAKINNQFYFCSAGLGFDALVAHKFAHAGSRGLKTYVKVVVNNFFNYKLNEYTIT
ncbi:MAG: diacylglycerol/lipid kinase family protein, partial [Bacteroidales bacterium]